MIADLRMRLLDLRNSNRLLSFKHSERAKTHVRIVDELPDQLVERLMTGKPMYLTALPEPENELPDEKSDEFLLKLEEERLLDRDWLKLLEEEEDVTSVRTLKIDREIRDRVRMKLHLPPAKGGKLLSLADWAQMNGIEPSFELPIQSDDGIEEKHIDDEIQTLLLPDGLQAKMAGILDHTRTALQETGVNILHLAVGFLEWLEAPTSEKSMIAPLLLYPVELKRRALREKGAYRYSVTGSEQEPTINITLRERLNRDFGIIVPEWTEGDTPELYMAQMAAAIAGRPGWRIRRFATLGLFSFSRLVMYNDLAPERWGENKPLPQRGVLSELFSTKDAGDFAPDNHNIDMPEIEAEVPLLIRDADSSQHAALIDVMRGKNIVIKGPPGTGKSQTIANIIAASLAKGKRVLFVAEKAAALDVVKKRLDEAELGDFCLELHSAKARKTDVLASLERRFKLKALSQPSAIEEVVKEAQSLRQRLSHHAEIMTRPFGALEIRTNLGHWRHATVHDLLWAEQRIRSIVPSVRALDGIFFTDCAETNRFDVERRSERLSSIERLFSDFISAFGGPENHPWNFITKSDVSILAVDGIIEATLRATEELSELKIWLEGGSISPLLPTELPDSLYALSAAAASMAELPTIDLSIIDELLRASVRSATGIQTLEDITSLLEERRHLSKWISQQGVEGGGLFDQIAVQGLVESARRAEVSAFSGLVIEVRAKAIRSDVANIRKVAEFSIELISSFGFDGLQATTKMLRTLLSAIRLVHGVDRNAILNRIPSVLDEAVRPVLERASVRLSQLLDIEQSIRERFSLDHSLSGQEVRRHSANLRSVSLFSRFSGDAKSARQFFKSISKAGEKVSDQQMADLLAEVADCLDARQSFEADSVFRAIVMHRYAGLDTDIGGLLAANQYASKVRSTFPGVGEIERTLRRLLLEADVETIDGLAAYYADQRFNVLSQLLGAEGLADDRLLFDNVDRKIAEAEALEQIAAVLKELGLPPKASADLAMEITTAQKRMSEIEQKVDSYISTLSLNERWQELDANVENVKSTVDIGKLLKKHDIPSFLLDRIVASEAGIQEAVASVQSLGKNLLRLVGNVDKTLKHVFDQVAIDPSESLSRYRAMSFHVVGGILSYAASAQEELPQWISWLRQNADARSDGLASILDAYIDASVPFEGLVAAYDRVLWRSLARSVVEAYPYLGEFQGRSLSDIRQRFRELDVRIMEMRRQKLCADLAGKRIPAGRQSVRKGECTDASLIENEIAKRKRHIPIRDLLQRAANAITVMKPCVMMSPASVALYLMPVSDFDLVVIDEASQMRPEEAIGTLARAKQAVIVGDPQQLPPTSFFERQDGDSVQGEDEEVEKVVAESILDFARGTFRPERELLWHYRSRHGSLIAFSNKHFYDSRLIVFPSPQEGHPKYGVNLVPLEGRYRASVNVPEAQAVANAAVDFMSKNPDKSLGIVALNQPHRDLILQEMDRLFIRDPMAERYRNHWDGTLEPFFVKNLENVQGDERDVIFISTVYGPDENGVQHQRFGPINGAAGDRRLNVLFSRAKHGVFVFSSLAPDKIRVDEKTPRGTRLLKSYLEFAATGRLDAGHTLYRDCESDFEQFVKERLEAHGYEVVAQVGVAGFRIDLGVRHPDWPYGFLVGIECDGAPYHSSLSARDRDRLRQQILEGLGWTIYRIWSTDWFGDQRREMNRLLSFLKQELANAKTRLDASPSAFTEASSDGSAGEVLKVAEPDWDYSFDRGKISDAELAAKGDRASQSEEEISAKSDSGEPKKVNIVYQDGSSALATLIGYEGNGRPILMLESGVTIRPKPEMVTINVVGNDAAEVISEVEFKSESMQIQITREEARTRLIQYREKVILAKFPESDRTKGVLRDRMLRAIIEYLPTSIEEFHERVPLDLRQQTDPRQMEFIGFIFEIIANVVD